MRVLTNGMAVSRAREATPGILPGTPDWREIEPNSISAFGTTISKTERSPIENTRSRRKGVITDLDSSVTFETDVTMTHLRMFAEEFFFARAVGPEAYVGSAATTNGVTVAALTASQAGHIVYSAGGAKSLIVTKGFNNPGNNGVRVASAAVAANATNIPVAGMTAETVGANQLAEVLIGGVRAAAGDLKIDVDGNLISTALDFTTLGLTPYQVIFIGGVDASNRFFNQANQGFARAAIITAHKITLTKTSQDFAQDDGTSTGAGGTALVIDLLFGTFVRNVPIGHPDYREYSVQFELSSPGLGPNGETYYEYAKGNYADTLSLAIPLTGKATLTLGYKGFDCLPPAAARAANAQNVKNAEEVAAFGTASDIARLRAENVDETGLTTDFKSATFTLSNQVAGEKVIGHLGPKYMNFGTLQCDVNSQILMTDPDVIDALRDNRTIGFDWAMNNDDGGAVFDLPTGTLSGGSRSFPQNQSVLLTATFNAHQEDSIGFTGAVSFFPILPAL